MAGWLAYHQIIGAKGPLFQGMRDISKNYYLHPERPVHLTHLILRMDTEGLDAASDGRRDRKIPASLSHSLSPSRHRLLCPVCLAEV